MAKIGVARAGSQSWILPGLLLLFVLPLLGYAGYTVADRWYQGYQLTREEMALRADIARLREHNLALQAELKDVRSDAYIEGVAREQLGLVKPGDRAIVLVGPPQTAALAKPAEPAQRRPESTEAAARRPEPTAEPAALPASGGWRKVLDAILGR